MCVLRKPGVGPSRPCRGGGGGGGGKGRGRSATVGPGVRDLTQDRPGVARMFRHDAVQMPKHGFRKEFVSFWKGGWDMLKSWTFMSLCLLSSLQWMSAYFVQNNLLLYTEYAVLLPDLFGILLLIALVSCVVFVPFWFWLLGKLSKRKVMAWGNLWLLMTWLLLVVVPAGTVVGAVIVAILCGGGITVRAWAAR